MSDKLTPSQLADALPLIFSAGQVPYIEGSPGIGKSDVIAQVARSMFGVEADDLAGDLPYLRDIKPAGRDPVDFTGLPVPDMNDRSAQWLRPGFLPTDGKGMVFIDELSAAIPQVQSVLLEFMRQRKAGDYRLPGDWVVAAAGNGAQHKAYATTMGSAMANRLVHLELQVSLDDWCKWAIGAGKNILTVAFIRFRPNLLDAFDPKNKEKAFPSPRSWTAVADLMDKNPSDAIRHALIKGCVGQAAATEMEGFLRVYKELPSIDQILADPENAPVPGQTDPAARYAISAALTERATASNIQPIATYAERLPAELNGMVMLGSVRRQPDIRNTEAFIKWGVANGELMA